jgi:hypothetical protein
MLGRKLTVVTGCCRPLEVIRQTRLVGCNVGQTSRTDFVSQLQQPAHSSHTPNKAGRLQWGPAVAVL